MDSRTIGPLADLTPDLLVQFMDELRDAGYNIGLNQYIAVQDLLLTLTRQGTLQDINQLKPFLGPVVCSTATEQTDFPQRFDQWAEQVRQHHYQPLRTEKEQAEALAEELEGLQQGANRLKRLLLGVVTIATVVFFHVPTPRQEYTIPETDVPESTTTTAPTGLENSSESIPTDLQKSLP